MSERVYAAQVELELRRRETLVMADVVLKSLREWAKTGERFELDLSGVLPDTQIPVGSLALWLDQGEYCNALESSLFAR